MLFRTSNYEHFINTNQHQQFQFVDMRASDEDNGDDGDDNENGKKRARKRISKCNSKEASKKDTLTSSDQRFDTEVLVRVILSRLVELIGVCQPDV
jgi:hypothetical protein